MLFSKRDIYTGRLTLTSSVKITSVQNMPGKIKPPSQEDIFEALSGHLKKLVENMHVGDPFATKVLATANLYGLLLGKGAKKN